MLLAASTGTGPRQLYAPVSSSPPTPESMTSDFCFPGHQSSSTTTTTTTTMDDLVPHHPQPLPSPSTPSGNVLTPTWRGMVMTTIDALKIIEACLSGVLMHTARRPHDREREHLIRSGNVFVYEESSSGIKRWTDGQNWSPSRILGNYLIYRELDKNFPPGDKKRAIKRKRDGKPELHNGHPGTPSAPASLNDERERALLGSLVDSYPFKEGGLIKKTISIKWNNVMHHLVSYYSLEDARNHRLPFPNDDPKLAHLRPRPDLIQLQDFRVPVEEEDPRFLDDRALLMGMIPHGSYAPTPTLERTISLPQMNNMVQSPYGTNQFHMGMPVHGSMASSMPMGSHYGHPPGNYVAWDQQRSRAPSSMQMAPYGTSMPDMMHGGTGSTKRRRSDAYESAEPDLFTHDISRAGQHYMSASTSSYAIPPHPQSAPGTETSDYAKSAGSHHMGPPPVTTTATDGLRSASALAYAPHSMTNSNNNNGNNNTSMDYPPMTAAGHHHQHQHQPPVSSTSSLSGVQSPVDLSSLTPTSPLTTSTLDGPNRNDQFFAPFNASNWNTQPHHHHPHHHNHHDSNSYLTASGRSLAGWHSASSGGGDH